MDKSDVLLDGFIRSRCCVNDGGGILHNIVPLGAVGLIWHHSEVSLLQNRWILKSNQVLCLRNHLLLWDKHFLAEDLLIYLVLKLLKFSRLWDLIRNHLEWLLLHHRLLLHELRSHEELWSLLVEWHILRLDLGKL